MHRRANFASLAISARNIKAERNPIAFHIQSYPLIVTSIREQQLLVYYKDELQQCNCSFQPSGRQR
jgi:hypothetical protein